MRCLNENPAFPETSNKNIIHFAGRSENKGGDMAFKILNDSVSKVFNLCIDRLVDASQVHDLRMGHVGPLSARSIVKYIREKMMI